VKAVFKTGGRNGLANKTITVFSNDPKNPRLMLTLKGEVTVDLEITPGSVVFGEVPMGQTPKKSVELKIAEPDKVHIKSVACNDPRFSTKLIPGDRPGRATLEVSFRSDKKRETITSAVKFLLDGPGVSNREIPIYLQVTGNLRYPKQIYLTKRGDVFNTREIDIVNRIDKPFRIKSVKDKDKRIKVDYPKTPDKEIHLTASVKDPNLFSETALRGTIQIQTTDPSDAAIEIGYTITTGQNRNASGMQRKPGAAK
jgi:hypothetical protein